MDPDALAFIASHERWIERAIEHDAEISDAQAQAALETARALEATARDLAVCAARNAATARKLSEHLLAEATHAPGAVQESPIALEASAARWLERNKRPPILEAPAVEDCSPYTDEELEILRAAEIVRASKKDPPNA